MNTALTAQPKAPGRIQAAGACILGQEIGLVPTCRM